VESTMRESPDLVDGTVLPVVVRVEGRDASRPRRWTVRGGGSGVLESPRGMSPKLVVGADSDQVWQGWRQGWKWWTSRVV
jgi:hypothetical protein